MKKQLLSFLALALAAALLLTSCSKPAEVEEKDKSTVPDEAITEFDDKYKNFYEIFVRSFYDSDGDGYGDFNGITAKLDYLKAKPGADDSKSLGINGVWLMPVSPSPSYHKYDVTDYYAVDSMYGTMEDFEKMVAGCHEHNITLIIDMVLNHTSNQHEWFKMFTDLVQCETKGETSQYDPKYREYYTCLTQDELEEQGAIRVTQTGSEYYHYSLDGARFRPIGSTDRYYECSFSDEMPELNFDSEYVWEEVEKICDFWIDKGVDGFRFDAVLWFYANDTERNTAVLRRIQEYCKSKNPDFYTVGEAWAAGSTVAKYYNSGFDSFFNFAYANTNGYIANTVKKANGADFAKKLQNWNNTLELVSATDAIDAPFVSNHDMYRSSSYFITLSQRKMAAGLYLMMPGNPFIYYGEEIGLKGTSKDPSQKDPTARMPIKWSAAEDGSKLTYPPGTDMSVNQDDIDGVAEQWNDEKSMLNYYRLILKLKNQNPQIARGVLTACDFGQTEVCAYTCTYDGTAVMVVHNIGLDEYTFDLNSLGYSDFSELRGYVVATLAEGESESTSAPVFGASSEEESAEEKEAIASLDGGKLVIPGRTTVVLRSTKHYDDIVINPSSITVSEEDSQVQGMGE